LFRVERGGKRLGAGRRRFQNQEIERRSQVDKKFPQGATQRRQRGRGFVAVGERLVTRRSLYQLELGHVPRKRRLRHANLHVRQTLPQLILAGDRLAGDEFQDLSLPKPFVCVERHRVKEYTVNCIIMRSSSKPVKSFFS